MACPSEDQLLQYVEGTASIETRDTIVTHCDQCESCRQALALYFRAVADASTTLSENCGAQVPKSSPEATQTDGAMSAATGTEARVSSAAVDVPTLVIGQRIGRYVVLRPLGAGGAGVVYLGHDPELDRQVALKLVRTDVHASEPLAQARARLSREAQAAARLSHPNVVTVYDFGTYGEDVFIAMELVSGHPLSAWLAEKSRTWREVLAVLLAAGRGLAAAHQVGIVHRDFKPSNVLIDEHGQARITDFGLARLAASDTAPVLVRRDDDDGSGCAELTRTGTVVGTPAYMSPEQFQHRPVDARSDQFSFCVSLYEALYGQRPFAGHTVTALAAAVTAGELTPAPPGREVPLWLHQVVMRGLAVDPEARFPSMQALLTALGHDPVGQRRRRVRMAAFVIGAAALGAVVHYSAGSDTAASASCRGVERELADIWDVSVREQLRRGFEAAPVPFAQDTWRKVATRLDTYTDQWVTMRIDTCEATRVYGEQSERVLDLRMHCLDRRLAEVKAFVTEYANADAAMVAAAITASNALTPLAECGDGETQVAQVPLPPDAARRAQVAAVRAQLDAAKARGDAGEYAEAAARAQAAVAAAESLAYRPLLAEAKYRWGQLAMRASDLAAAEQALMDAVWLAEASGHDEVAADTWLALVALGQKGDYVRGNRWATWASAAVERLGGDRRRRVLLTSRLGGLAWRQAEYQQALNYWRNAVAVESSRPVPDPVQLAEDLQNLAMAEKACGLLVDAAATWRRALHLSESTWGADHPRLVGSLIDLCATATDLGDYDQAMTDGQRAVVIAETSLSAGHLDLARAHFVLGNAFLGADRYARAIEHLRHAQRIQEIPPGADTLLLVSTLVALGEALRATGALDDALATCRRAWEMSQAIHLESEIRSQAEIVLARVYIDKGAFGKAVALASSGVQNLGDQDGADYHPQMAHALLTLGHAHHGIGDLPTARQYLERAVARFQSVEPGDRIRTAQAKLLLARILWDEEQKQTGDDKGRDKGHDARHDPDRARALVREARDIYVAAGARYAADTAEATTWLQTMTHVHQ